MTGKADAVNFMYKSKYFIALALVAVLVTAQASNVYSISSSNVATYNKWTTVNYCNYTIFTDGTTTYAKTGDTGAVAYSGTNAASIIQSAANANTNGGNICIASGTYSITQTINIIYTGTKIIGGGMKNTYLQGSPGVIVFTVGTDSVDIGGVTFRDLTLNGGSIGINKRGVYELFVENVWFESMTQTGLLLTGLGATATSNAYVSNSVFNLNRDGIEANNGFANLSVVNTLNTASTRYGIFWNTTGSQLKVIGGDIQSTGVAGIYYPSGFTTRNLSVTGVDFDAIHSGTGITINGTLLGFNIIGSYFKVMTGGGQAMFLKGATNGVVAGNEFFGAVNLANSTNNWVYANRYDTDPSGAAGLTSVDSQNYIEAGNGITTQLVRQPFFRDDFFGAAVQSWWRTTGTGSPTFVLQNQANGILRMSTSATSGNTAQIDWSGLTTIDVSKKPVMTASFLIDSNNSSWTMELRRDASNLIWLTKLSSTQAQLRSVSGGSVSTINFNISGAHTTSHEYRIDIRPDVITAYEGGTAKASITTNIPSGLLEPQIIMTTNENVSHYMDLDFVDVREQR